MNPLDHEPGAATRFALAYERFAIEDERRSEYLSRACGIADLDESDEPPPEMRGPPCACGCGRPIPIRLKGKGPPFKYASDACRKKVWERFKPKSHRGRNKRAGLSPAMETQS